MNIAAISFTGRGAALLEIIKANLAADFLVYSKEKSAVKDFVRGAFSHADAIIFVGAVGLAVRLIAPFLRGKDIDPAVVVMDEAGRFAIPILSGHIGGANALANEISNITGLSCVAVITTATDVNGLFSVDEWATNAGCAIGDTANIKHISGAILRGEQPCFCSDFDIIGALPNGLILGESGGLGVCVSLNGRRPFDITMSIIPKIITVGIGCKKGISYEEMLNFFLKTLENAGISVKAVRAIATIDIKRDEPCIKELAREFSLPLEVFTAQQLGQVEGKFSASEFVKSTIGVDNVCERSAVAACKNGKLTVKKIKSNGMTMALAEDEWRCKF